MKTDTPRTDALQEPEAVTKLRSKTVAIAAHGSTVIAWPENHSIINHIEELKNHARQLERELNEAKQDAFNVRQILTVAYKERNAYRKKRNEWRELARDLAEAFKGQTSMTVDSDCKKEETIARFNQLNQNEPR